MFVLEITILNLININWRMFHWLSSLCSECYYYYCCMCLYPAHLASTAPQDEKLVIFPRLLVTSPTAVGIFHFPDQRCLHFNNTAASSDACHQPPPLSAQNTSPLSIFLGDTRHKINKTRCNIQHTGGHTLQTPVLLPMTMRQDLKLTTILRTENFLCRYSYKKTRASAAVKQADQPCNMLSACR